MITKQILLTVATLGCINSYALWKSESKAERRFQHLEDMPMLYDACSTLKNIKQPFLPDKLDRHFFGQLIKNRGAREIQGNALCECDALNGKFKNIKETGNAARVINPSKLEQQLIQDRVQDANNNSMFHIIGAIEILTPKPVQEDMIQTYLDPEKSDHENMLTIRQMIKDHQKELRQQWEAKNAQ